uniref:Uncharacterized protein n=1 Tax=Arion vulgaris TaxID=1028688 RepID=A0A0B6ZJB5_9EUPU
MLSDGIPLDRESLVKQLDLLRYINMRLQNQKNVAETIDARLRNTRETNHRNTKPVQGKGFVSKIQYYPTTFPRGDDC